ncbi:DUF2868 domain-containing protein [Thiocapsa bogorovii]|uniref:DUF2868 domain-containing protein n=1 Tax=Thiocapsa bogorovii TaxID=521689 RepID=UPI001E3F0675|nr:DUF2868 domain-containing protein [Thiocapsa bogorovii]UHD16179.1 DUF2868 domain-containing protein [Thiocapsa bogorovii]
MDFRHHPNDSGKVHAAPDEARDWAVADLIDFEYYLEADERELREHPSARKTLAERDRSLYLEAIAPEIGDEPPHTPTHRRFSLRRWLAARRNAERPEMRGILPGAAFGSAERLVTMLLAVVGFIAGVGVASALLSYDGTRPVSVSWYLFLLVIVQFLLVVSVATAWTLRKVRGRGAGAAPGLLMHIVRPLVAKAASWLQRQRIGHAAAEIQDQARARQGLFKAQYAVYGPVSYLPLLIPAQVFGVAFNLGVILTTVLLEWFTDLAFGWGSTLNVHPQTIFDMTRLIALPWSWLFGEGVGYPSLEQVAGSRIILEHWATATPTIKPDPAHLRSWGSFLVLAVTTYGLLPRLMLWSGSVLAQRMILARLPFTHSRTQALYARMLSPRIETTPSGGRAGTEMPIPAVSTQRKPRASGAGGLAEAAPTTSARPWRNALVRRVEPGGEASPPPIAPPAPKPATPAVALPPVEVAKAAPAREPEQQPAQPREAEAPSRAAEDTTAVVAEGAVEVPVSGTIDRAATPPSVRQSEREPKPAPEPTALPKPAPAAPVIPEPTPASDRAAAGEALPPATPRPVARPESEPQTESKPEAAEERPAETEGRLEERPAAPAIPATSRAETKKTKAQAAGLRGSESKSPEKPPTETPAQPSAQPQIAETPKLSPEPAPTLETAAQTPPTSTPAHVIRFAPDACLLLLHVDVDDILEDEDRPRLEQMLMHLTGWQVAATTTVGAGSAMTDEALGILERGDWQAPPPRVVVIEDGSQPPITESLRFLRELRAAAGTRAQILLALVGDPTDDDRLPPMRPFDYTDWQRKIDQMADPYLRLEMLAPPHEDGDD